MHKMSLLVFAAATCGLASAPAFAAANDAIFADQAARGGKAEVQAGHLAQQKGASSQVKQFGQTLVQDHTQGNQQLEQIARQENLSLPTRPSEDQMSQAKKLEGLSGRQFDRQFLQDQVKDHRKDIGLYQREAQTGKDGALQAYAQQSLPMLRKHLQIAESLAKH